MKIIGCDFHTRQQQIAMLDTDTGEMVERRWEHAKGEARKFYEALPKPVRVGIEANAIRESRSAAALYPPRKFGSRIPAPRKRRAFPSRESGERAEWKFSGRHWASA